MRDKVLFVRVTMTELARMQAAWRRSDRISLADWARSILLAVSPAKEKKNGRA